MTLTAKRPKNDDFPPIEGGTYQGVCYSVVDLGTQHTSFEGQEKDVAQVAITWEIPELRIDIDGKSMPRAISKIYTNSLGKKATLLQHLTSWRGKEFTEAELDGFEIDNVLQANCILTIINEPKKAGGMKAKVLSVAHLMKGMPSLKPENSVVSYNMARDSIDAIPASVPDWLKKIIEDSMEYRAIHNARNSKELAAAQASANYATPPDDTSPEQPDDDIPF